MITQTEIKISPTWTLSMALIWIIYRNPTAVREIYDELQPLSYDKLPFFLAFSYPASEPGAIDGFADAEAQLKDALIHRKLTLTGKRVGDASAVVIQEPDLRYFPPLTEHGIEWLGPYFDLLLLESEVLSRWPETQHPALGSIALSALIGVTDGQRGNHHATPLESKQFLAFADGCLAKDQRGPTVEQSYEWGKDKGIVRESMRKLIKDLPDHLKLGRNGKPLARRPQ